MTSAPSPPECLDDRFCKFVYDVTSLDWLAEGGYYLLAKPIRIAIILVLALLARHVAHRVINRLVASVGEGRGPELLRPLRDRMPPRLQTATLMRSERRRQRARALGSVLLSVASAVVFTVAAMLVLAELGMNLGPLLASAGIAGLALGFGAQNLVKDFIAGLFMLLEDQYGVGDTVDLGDVTGTVEAVGLRTTTVRDNQGVIWYIRNGEIARVGNRSQGWAAVEVDIPVELARLEQVIAAMRAAAATLAEDPAWRSDLLEPPQVLGVEHLTGETAVIRTTVRTTSESQGRVARELRHRLTQAVRATTTPPGAPTQRGVSRSERDET